MEKISAQQFADNIAERIKAQYNALGLPASRRFEKELEPTAEDSPFRKHIVVYGSAYSGAMISGRAKNTNQSPEAIKAFVGWAGNTWAKQWVEDKGLTISPFAVAYKIARQGVTVPNPHNSGALLDTALPQELINEYVNSLVMAKVSELRSDVANVLIHKK